MLKGINRNVLVVSSDKTGKFESVYFVLRRGDTHDRADILKEANRIIAASGLAEKPDKKRLFNLISFAVGVVAGMLSTALVGVIIIIC